MVSFDDIESIIEEWFDDYSNERGIGGLAKLYAKVQYESDKNFDNQLQIQINKINKQNG